MLSEYNKQLSTFRIKNNMSFRRRLKGKQPPDGWDLIEDTIEDFEAQMRDAVSEEHEGKRKNELTWRIHQFMGEESFYIRFNVQEESDGP